MKLNAIELLRMRNDEHFQYMTALKTAVKKYGGAGALKIEKLYDRLEILYNQEDEALKKILKSIITDEIQEADSYRDQIFRGMADTAKAALNHFDQKISKAAQKLKIVFDTYGNLAKKTLNEETSAVYNLLQDLFMKYKDESHTVGIMDWMYELQNANQKFDQLMTDRYDESAMKTDLVLREVRLQLDAVYRSIVERINAAAVMEDNNNSINGFIKYFNEVIQKYNDIIAQRKGRSKNND